MQIALEHLLSYTLQLPAGLACSYERTQRCQRGCRWADSSFVYEDFARRPLDPHKAKTLNRMDSYGHVRQRDLFHISSPPFAYIHATKKIYVMYQLCIQKNGRNQVILFLL